MLLLPARPFIALARKLGRLVKRVLRLAILAAAVTALVTVLDALFAPSGKGRDRGE